MELALWVAKEKGWQVALAPIDAQMLQLPGGALQPWGDALELHELRWPLQMAQAVANGSGGEPCVRFSLLGADGVDAAARVQNPIHVMCLFGELLEHALQSFDAVGFCASALQYHEGAFAIWGDGPDGPELLRAKLAFAVAMEHIAFTRGFKLELSDV